MKFIVAIIRPEKLEAVQEALAAVEVVRMTALDVQGFGRQRGRTETFRGRNASIRLVSKMQLQIAVNDAFVEPTIAAIEAAARSDEDNTDTDPSSTESGKIGDGKIFVLDLEDCIRIRTGDRGPAAI